MKIIDSFLNSITMYKLLVAGLGVLFVYSLILALAGVLASSPLSYVLLFGILLGVGFLSNLLFSKLYKVPANTESWLITSLILYFVVSPVSSLNEGLFVALTAFVAMASKYVLTFRGRHIFNPAAFALVVLGLVGGGSVVALWWIGTPFMFPAVLIVSLLVVRKIRKEMFFAIFILVSLVVMFALGTFTPMQALLSWPLIFFGAIMVTEPLTMPGRSRDQIWFAGLVAILAAIPFNIAGFVYGTPELALVLGNVAAWIVNPKRRLSLKLTGKAEIAKDVYEFSFQTADSFVPAFTPGQYAEWTLAHKDDSRGVRRYFTIASSPTEGDIKLGVKFNPQGSSFKEKLLSLEKDDLVYASAHMGDFVLPSDTEKKIGCIAGGIGVTPFRSMIQYLRDAEEKRDIVLIYTVKDDSEYAYQDVFNKAAEELGITIIYLNTEKDGFINQEKLLQFSPDFNERLWYLSGPNVMVDSYKKLLRKGGVGRGNIKTDYFPGF